jgi:hypothetical protein
VLLVVPASLIGTTFISDIRFRQEWRTPKELTGSFTALLIIGLIALVLGTLWPQLLHRPARRGPWPAITARQQEVLERAAPWLFWGTVFGYVAFAAVGTLRGVSPVGLVRVLLQFNTSNDFLKQSFAPVAGVTTFTQLDIAFVTTTALTLRRTNKRAIRRLAVVLALATLRAVVLSERLAVLEIALPLVLIAALRVTSMPRPRARLAVRLAPAVLVPAVVVFFGVFEYVRSWQFYAPRAGESFVSFALVRFAGYYSTAYNNASIAYSHASFPHRLPFASIEVFWSAPGISQLNLYQRLSGGDAQAAFNAALQHYGNPEFNNYGGLGAPFLDFGPVGGAVYLFALGSIAGLCWTSLRAGRFTPALFYPMIMTSLFELPRYIYLAEGRIFPSLVALAVIAWLARRPRRGRAAQPAPAGVHP